MHHIYASFFSSASFEGSKRLFAALCLLVHLSAGQAQVISIAAARALPEGSGVTVRGIVTNGPELGNIRFLQDGTAGIAAFPGTGSAPGFAAQVKTGDLIEITGVLYIFQGLLEISPITAFTVITSGNPLPTPQAITLGDLSADMESRLVEVECLYFSDQSGALAGGDTYEVHDQSGATARIYLRSGHPMSGAPIPTYSFHLRAIVSRFGGLQLLPRNWSDLEASPCLFFSLQPEPTTLTTTQIGLRWATSLPAPSWVRYGASPTLLNEVSSTAGGGILHEITLNNLQPGTVYWTQLTAVYNGDTARSALRPYVTRSLSSGQIDVYFSGSVDAQFLGAKQPAATTPEACLAAVLNRIQSAQQSIDVCMYNINRSDIAAELSAAHARGVQVRYIAAAATNNNAFNTPPPFPVVYGNDIALMHNKFMIIDADLAADCWVMGGSMNWTSGNIFNDYNNTLFIQDQSLARAYEIEFEEMWGGAGPQPNSAQQRFGFAKTDNTPHYFIIGEAPVQLWFSPSDGVTEKIVQTINTGNASIEFALFSFTKNEPGDALAAKFNDEQVGVRGLIDNINDVGSEYWFLKEQGVPVGEHFQSGELHHKYMVADALQPTSDPVVLTGSHNWSVNAETQNDENTLILFDADIARLFRAEFEKRYAENPVATTAPVLSGFSLAPNPAIESFVIHSNQYDLDAEAKVQIWSAAGRLLREQAFAPGQAVRIADLPNGAYIVKIKARNAFAALPLQKISR